MTKIIYDAVLRERLPNLAESMELCDESGHVLARISPVIDPELYTDLEPQIGEEEVMRRLTHKGKTYTTAEVLAYLGQL
jgi:hypothetical protein